MPRGRSCCQGGRVERTRGEDEIVDVAVARTHGVPTVRRLHDPLPIADDEVVRDERVVIAARAGAGVAEPTVMPAAGQSAAVLLTIVSWVAACQLVMQSCALR